MLTLYTDAHYISPYAWSCFVALREKGLSFEEKPVNLATREHHAAEYRDRSLTGRVPALRHHDAHGEFWLSESSAIIEYLDDVFPAPGHPRALPAEPHHRARARQIMAWVRSDLSALREERPTTTMFYQRAENPLSKLGEEAAERLLRVAGNLIAEGATSLFGEWSAADADLAFMLQRLILNGHEVPEKIRAFAAAQWRRPSVREWTEKTRIPYVGY